MKIVSFNANGIRSATRKGFFDWFARQRADILCIQELKAKTHQIDTKPFIRNGYSRYIFEAEKPGYSGVCIYTRIKPKKIIITHELKKKKKAKNKKTKHKFK